MRTYLLRRFGSAIVTLVLVSFIAFFVMQLPPGDYVTQLEQTLEASGQVVDQTYLKALRQKYALDKPLVVQYWKWISKFVQGDFGESPTYNRPVRELIGDRLYLTLAISITTLVFTWIIAVPIGIFSAVRQYSAFDHVFTAVGFIGLAVPNFLLALLMIFASIFWFDATSVGGLFSREFINAPWSLAKLWDLIRHLWIPVVVVGTSGTAGLIRIMRGNLLDILGRPFVETARAKGLKERVVTLRHAVRVAINPLISILGMSLPGILSGAVITAIVLNLPTVGPLMFAALQDQDMYLAGAILMLMAVALVVGNFIADLLLAWSDPRIRLGEE